MVIRRNHALTYHYAMLTTSNLKRLTLLYLLVIVPIAGWATYQIARDRLLFGFADEIETQLELFVSDLQGEIEKYAFLPRVLANDSNIIRLLTNSDDAQQIGIVNQLLFNVNHFSNASDTYLMSNNGTTIAASNWNQQPTFVGENFAFRPYFQQAMDGEQGRYFALGTTSRRRGYYFSSPVYDETTDDIIGATVVKVDMDRLETAWRDYDPTLLIADEHDVVFSTNKREWQFLTLSPLTAAVIEKIKRDQQYPLDQLKKVNLEIIQRHNNGDEVRLMETGIEGHHFRIARSLPDLGWTVHALGNLSPLKRDTLYRVAGVVLASLMLWTLFSAAALRRISLREQLELRKRTEKQLIEAKDDLERRVDERTKALMLSNEELQQEITERRRAEKELRQAQAELVHAAKLAALGQLSAGITHELNQPLAAIGSYADNALTLMQRNAYQDANSNIEQILRLTDRMSQITAHLKSYSRKTDDAIDKVDVRRCVNDALSLVNARMRTLGVEVKLNLLESAHVAANAVRLEQVFVNLFSNALDAMENSDQRRLSINQREQDNLILTIVTDSGSGIDAKDIDYVFDPFFTTKDVGVGLGLGLSISNGIVQNLGGQLKVENHPEGGASFTIVLPKYVT